MILLNSNAEHIFWLGRYLTRTQYLCSIFPFQEDEAARDYAHAFCLPAFDASSLNELVLDPQQSISFISQFQYAQNNILDLRGVLSAQGYAELNKLIQMQVKMQAIFVMWRQTAMRCFQLNQRRSSCFSV